MKTILMTLMVGSLSLATAACAEDPGGTAPGAAALFAPASECMACHNGLVTPGGLDVSIGPDWSSSMMAHAARDPYWQAAVRRETLEHPTAAAAIEDECSACHMPMERFQAKASGGAGQVFAHLPAGAAPGNPLALDGVSCTLCHQIEAAGLGTRESFTAGFSVDRQTPMGTRRIYGPFPIDAGRKQVMRSASRFEPAQGLHIQSSEFCATCHTLYTHSLDPAGKVVGELPEQVPYLEWRHSDYRESQSCQACHMPVVEEKMPVSSVLGVAREGFSRHVFRGGNFFMLKMLDRHREELGVETLSRDMQTTAQRTLEHLETAAAGLRIEHARLEGGELKGEILVESRAGHKLPTAYPSRRVWVHFTVVNDSGKVVFESGAFQRDGSIQGNDNDSDPTLFEPHHRVLADPEQVQIYETILADPEGGVTTGLLRATRYLKDNRILPIGFDKSTAAPDIAVQGRAADDPDFTGGGDRILLRVPVEPAEGPFQIRVELLYQSIAYRWAMNLSQQEAPEIQRFISYYEALAEESAALLASASIQVD